LLGNQSYFRLNSSQFFLFFQIRFELDLLHVQLNHHFVELVEVRPLIQIPCGPVTPLLVRTGVWERLLLVQNLAVEAVPYAEVKGFEANYGHYSDMLCKFVGFLLETRLDLKHFVEQIDVINCGETKFYHQIYEIVEN